MNSWLCAETALASDSMPYFGREMTCVTCYHISNGYKFAEWIKSNFCHTFDQDFVLPMDFWVGFFFTFCRMLKVRLGL